MKKGQAMGEVSAPEGPKEFQVRIGQEELGRIFHLRDSLEQSEALIQHADRYRELGWVLEARGEEVESLDFSQPSEVWGERLMTLALAGVEVNLGIRTGLPSRLLVVETPRGETLLDSYGDWRSLCRAAAGADREQHYYVLPPGCRLPGCGELVDFQLRIYGQGGVVPVPPSRHDKNGSLWTWVTVPWETPPGPPNPPVWDFLEDFGLLQEAEELPEVPPWDQVYARIASHEALIRALLAPAGSVPAYYREVAQQAALAGIRDPALLFAVLWHAPQGDARTSPGRLAYIRELAAAASGPVEAGEKVPSVPPSPGKSPRNSWLPVQEPPHRSTTWWNSWKTGSFWPVAGMKP